MKVKAQVLFTLVVLVFFIVFVYLAKDWRLQARLYPWTIGIPMIFLAALYIVRELTGKYEKRQSQETGNTPVDFQFSKGVDLETARRRTFNIFGWIFGFFVGIWLIGFAYMVPLFVFLYLKVQARESWPLSIALTGGAWLMFWALFTHLLKLPFPDGQVLVWLGLN
ncbi:MAG TPA: tripartite tricarboxylate transporter TctB family protein [Candidatus Acidoferrales bacterium]|nr:tripartite tricarboxylate transporter TctB family protein [Candidatus Acidoferrales bacterium]